VQGVGFRWFVLQQASALHLGGYVRNLPDGSVEVLARGAEAGMTKLEQALHRGPSSARVEIVEKSDVPHDIELPKPFDVQ
jgi:acylphosphatase